uniref:Zinc finger protein 473 n=2 Tax=Bos taurus TaxID=9913 RepID=A0ABI0NMN5_BOVIN
TTEEIATLKDIAMDFTSENWEQLGQGQGDLFWDMALDNYWNLFLLNPPGPNLTFHPDGGEKLEALVKESPESTDTGIAETSPLPQDFLEAGLFQEITETFSKDDLWNSHLGEASIGQTWLDSLLGDSESLLRSDIISLESPTECKSHKFKSHELKIDLSPESHLSPGAGSMTLDLPEKSLAPAKSQECGNDFGCYSDHSQHDTIQGGEKPYECSECGKSFSQSYHMIQHWILHNREQHPTVLQEYEKDVNQRSCLSMQPVTHTGYKSYVYNKFGETFSENTHLLCHQKVHTEEEPWESQDGDCPADHNSQPFECHKPPPGKTYNCKECGQSFSQTFHLSVHQKTHTQKCYECAKCKATFNSNRYLLQHQKIHAAKMIPEDQECGKACKQSSFLVQQQSVHTAEKPYKCDECEKTFSHSLALKIHQRVHSGEKNYKCNECGKAFYRNSHLSEHQRVHTGYRPHKCHKCVKSFSRPSHLIRHLSMHATEKLYSCAKCKKTFSHNEHLVQHQKIHAVETP